MSYEGYKAFLGIHKLHSDPSTHYKNNLQNIIDSRFEYASDYKVIDYLDRTTLSSL